MLLAFSRALVWKFHTFLATYFRVGHLSVSSFHADPPRERSESPLASPSGIPVVMCGQYFYAGDLCSIYLDSISLSAPCLHLSSPPGPPEPLHPKKVEAPAQPQAACLSCKSFPLAGPQGALLLMPTCPEAGLPLPGNPHILDQDLRLASRKRGPSLGPTKSCT